MINASLASGDLYSFYKYPKRRDNEKIKESSVLLPTTHDKKYSRNMASEQNTSETSFGILLSSNRFAWQTDVKYQWE